MNRNGLVQVDEDILKANVKPATH